MTQTGMRRPHMSLRARSFAGARPDLDADQRAVVEHTGSPLLVLAGPGTGKTTTIVESVIARLTGEAPIPPERVLVLTFSRGAAAELRSRIVARSPGVVAPVVSTFHAFAWRLLREHSSHGDDDPAWQLLSAPDAELAVRELLADPADAWSRHWPADRRAALSSPALVDELLGLMSAARAQGWEPSTLAAAARAGGALAGGRVPAEWLAAAAFFEHYLDVLDWRGALDYAEVIHRARLLVADTPELVGHFAAIYVDEYQDTDPAQVALVRSLTAPGSTVVAVGDPDQAIYRFRGADVQGILDFPQQFASPDGRPADVAVLRHTRRFGPAIRAIADRWIAPVGLGGLPVDVQRRHRSPQCAVEGGEVEVISSPTRERQARALADLVRRAHLRSEDPLAWSDMAVVVRSGVNDIPRLERALLAAGVPVEVPAGDRPLAHEPALAPLLTGLRLADDPHNVELTELEGFMCSPLVGMTPLSLRRLLRALRVAERAEAAEQGRPPRAASWLLARCFDPHSDLPPGIAGDLVAELDAILDTIDRMRAPDLTVAERLWQLWSHGAGRGSQGRWARALRQASLAGGSGAHRADTVLDSVIELFSVAERMPKGAGSSVFVETLTRHRIPAAPNDDSTRLRDSVALLTVHRAKGAQWPMVVIVGAQQDEWPDARGPASLLAPERIGREGVQAPRTRSELVADERRLAFVAATRASQRLVIMAVDSAATDQSPSVLFTEAAELVGVTANPTDAESSPTHGRDRLTPTALVASLRSALGDESLPMTVRSAAADRLARLATPNEGARAVAPDAHPARWWGLDPTSAAAAPLTPPEQPVRLSATAVEAVNECPLRWFLNRRVSAGAARPVPAAYGSLIHAAIAAVVSAELEAEPAAMAAAIRPAFEELPYAADWERERAWRNAQDDIARFVGWFRGLSARPMAAEVPLDLVVGVSDDATGAAEDAVSIRLTGSIDLLLVDDEGRLQVVDFKTGGTVPSAAATRENVQLGVYQLAVAQSGLAAAEVSADLGVESSGQPGGGALVYLAKGVGKGASEPTQRQQPALEETDWLDAKLGSAATTIAAERIVARVSSACEWCDFRRMCPAFGTLDWIGGE